MKLCPDMISSNSGVNCRTAHKNRKDHMYILIPLKKRRGDMATESFDMSLVIDTDEAAENFLKAINAADARGPLKTRDFSKELLLGEELIEKGLDI